MTILTHDGRPELRSTGEAAPIGDLVALLQAGAIGDEDLRAVLGAAVRAYARLQESRSDHVVPYDAASGVTPTDALRTAAGLLRESDVSSFEMAMMFNI